MPDWFYRTAAQRVLFCFPDEPSRGVALGLIGFLGRNAAGRAVIDFMGHMAPEPALAVRVAGVEFPSPVGLGWRVDPEQRATCGLMCFGVGCIEVRTGPGQRVRRGRSDELQDGEMVAACSDSTQGKCGPTPVLRRQRDASGRETILLPNGVELPVVAWDAVASAADVCSKGVLLQVGEQISVGRWVVPVSMPASLPEVVRDWRKKLPEGAAVIVSGGVGNPGDAVALINAGASLLLVDAGMVFRGPGLIKRCNEALSLRLTLPSDARCDAGFFRRAWFWASALGVAMILGGGLTIALALTRVLLPYDEHYLGLTADALRRNSPRLFAFMAHDRGTLAGTMLGLGWLYLVLAWHGVRRARHGAKTAVIASALAGFASFFSFFGFGYFDTLHAFVAVVLFQLTVQIMVGEEGGAPRLAGLVDEENAARRRALWGQLMWIVHSIGLLIAGCVILGIGMTSVFVGEDLQFLCLTEPQAKDLGARLIAVVAHDRATLGGMLLASGVAMLLPVLWCFRRGERWLWWAMAGLGAPAYGIAIGVHFMVGYTDWRHMVPAFVGLGLWLGGLWLARTYLRGEADAAAE